MSVEGVIEILRGSPPELEISAMPWEEELPRFPDPKCR
jgi:hypothetical protein